MGNVRRWYVYLVCAVTIQAVTWAAINLLRNLAIVSTQPTAIAFQISVIIIALPLFLAHWIWAQRRAGSDEEERAALPRLLYLYVMMAAFLVPLINNAYFLVRALLHLIFGVAPNGYYYRAMSPGRSVWFNLVPLVVLGALWFYHRRVRTEDEKIGPVSEASTLVRQLYVYLFTLIGLVMFSLASISLLRWLLVEPFRGGSAAADTGRLFLAAEIARLAVSLPLWLLFWRYAQGLFYGPAEEERQSIVRKAYLYLIIFGSVMTVVTVVTIVLSDAISRLMDVPSLGGDIRQALAIVAVAGLMWAYHTFVLRRDAEAAEGKEQAANIRRIYLYLTAGIGLAAVLIGLVGVLNALIRALATSAGFIVDLREQLGLFVAILLAGLPLWLINWYRAQQATYEPDPAGQAERQALVRRLYLYFYLFVATLAFLGSAIYILSQIIELALDARSSKLFISDIGQALAYMVIAAAVWFYHGSILRREWRLAKTDEASKLRPLRVAVVDTGDGSLGHAIIDRIHQQLPRVELLPLGLSSEAAAVMNGEKEHEPPEKILAEAELIVGPWNMGMSGAAGGLVTESIALGVVANPAPKVIIPVREQGWEWTGVERWKEEDILKETAEAVKQAAIGEEIKSRRRLGAGSIALIVLGVLFVLLILVPSVIGLIFFLLEL